MLKNIFTFLSKTYYNVYCIKYYLINRFIVIINIGYYGIIKYQIEKRGNKIVWKLVAEGGGGGGGRRGEKGVRRFYFIFSCIVYLH